MPVELRRTGVLAKVTAVGEDGRAYCDFQDGKSGSFVPPEPEFVVGDVLLIAEKSDGGSHVEKVPDTMWPDMLWVGVVKLRKDDLTVIDSGGRWRAVPSVDEPKYKVGNTVQAGDTRGVVRILSEQPIRYVDLPEVDDSAIKAFRVKEPSRLDFDDFGGLPTVVSRARELIEVPLQSGKALSSIGARTVKGILFTGPPGTGKTLLARVIASQSGATFFEISGPQIFSKWYGQSEEVLRRIFGAAKAEERAIVFFDEIDSVAAQRDDHSHEASRRVVAQLLTLMDGFSSAKNVIVIAATNRPQDLDTALRRPGRFDSEIEFPYPNEPDRRDILEKTARRIRTRGTLPHGAVARQSHGWSAAQLTQIWTEAAYLAAADGRCMICDEDYVGGFERVSRYRAERKQMPRSADGR